MDQYIHGIAVAARGVPVTLIISLVAVLGGLVLGLLVALAKRSKFKILRGIATVYVDILRGTPLLVQVLILGYGVPQLVRAITGMQFNWEPLILVGFIACGVNSSAYMAEIIRSGLQAVDIGQTEAARSLGLNSRQTMRYVIVPQAFKIIVPALGNEFVTLIKETSILSIVGVAEKWPGRGTYCGHLHIVPVVADGGAYRGGGRISDHDSRRVFPTLVSYMERRMAQSDRS